MEISAMPSAVSFPAYFVNYTGGTILASMQANSSRSHLMTVLSHTTAHTQVAGQNNEQGSRSNLGDSAEDDDSFGEHYFHICIYIWACVVISSLIALSVKWGCCGRSLTRWEVKRIPLKRFQRVDGEDSQDKCPICHEEFHEERLIRQLPCNHCYHSYCVDRWLVKMSNRCPLCKQRVSISLLCPWNKQRRKKEITGQLTADMEASVDDSPPLPPLATLTPSNWYGEEIMSGPSKFIILRPGKPTRVIDVREKKKPTVSHKTSPGKLVKTFQPADDVNAANCISQNFGEIIAERNSNADVCEISSIHSADENVVSLIQADDVLPEGVQIPSACSSRNLSISSDQPLLFQNQCNLDDDGEAKCVDELQHSIESLKCSIPLMPLVHSQESINNKQPCDHELGCTRLPRMEEVEHRNNAQATVTLSSRSSSVVSCSMKTPDTKLELLNPSINRTHFITKHSANSATLDWLECLPNCMSPVPALYNKRHTLPGKITQSWTPPEFIPSNTSDNCILERFRKPAAVRERTNNS